MMPPSHILFMLLPVVLGGTCNMVFVKSRFLDRWKVPMDGGATLQDGRRIFGDHKTWKGFVGMIVLTAAWMAVMGWLVRQTHWAGNLSPIAFEHFSSPLLDWLYGGLWGLAYVTFELPNSYIKRRLDIQPGKQGKGLLHPLFLCIDQADSAVGVVLVTPLFCQLQPMEALVFLVLGTAVHYVMNILLFFARLKKQMG